MRLRCLASTAHVHRARPQDPRALRFGPPGSAECPTQTARPSLVAGAPQTPPSPPPSSSGLVGSRCGSRSPRLQPARSDPDRSRPAPRLQEPPQGSAALPGAPGSNDPAPSSADHPSRPEAARVSSPGRILSSSGCSLQGPRRQPAARFLSAQAGCIPTPFSSKPKPSPPPPSDQVDSEECQGLILHYLADFACGIPIVNSSNSREKRECCSWLFWRTCRVSGIGARHSRLCFG